jgi:type IV secretory pathway TrbD component
MPTHGIPTNQSLIRPALRGGADRVLIIVLYMTVGIFVLALPWTNISLSVAAALVVIGHPALIVLCKYDPDWRRIVRRLITYQPFYPAAAHPSAPTPRRVPAIPSVQECR